MQTIRTQKAAGPDRLEGIILKSCKEQLSPVFRGLFQKSIDTHTIPVIWKTAEIVPLPKKPKPVGPNDFRPVALTSVAMKCFERIILTRLKIQTHAHMDTLQFAYREGRGVEDAVTTLLNGIYKHLETPASHVRILFADFSSAFNTIQSHMLLEKLTQMGVNLILVQWIQDFLTGRQQFVRAGHSHSSTIITNTGVPQGCVLSPLLFILYTNDCVSHHSNCSLIKFADDAALVGFLTDSDQDYRSEVDHFHDWCNQNSLILNISKTKEMMIDFRKRPPPLQPVTIHGTVIETVEEYKYLGTIIDHKLTWTSNTQARHSKAQQRLHFLKETAQF